MRIMHRVKNESGVALIIALSVLAVLLMLAGVVMSAATNLNASSNRDTVTKRAFEAAQAGLQATVYRMNMQINSQTKPPAELREYCVGGPKEEVQRPTSGTTSCPLYTESLGNGASYTTWTTAVFTGRGNCAGVEVGTSDAVFERCVTSQGTVTRAGRTVTHRVQERVAAFASKPVFPVGGVIGENGVLIKNTAKVEGPIYTNGQIEALNQAKSEGYGLGPNAATPIVAKTASIGKELEPVNPWPTYSPIPPEQEKPEGNQRIENAFRTCTALEVSEGKCARDVFSGCSTAAACGWDAKTRTLNLKGSNWVLGGATYNFCSLTIESATAKLAAKLKTVIYIDSPSDPTSNCPPGTGYFKIKTKGEFINESPALPGSPLKYDTTALVIFIFGPSDIEKSTIYNNACIGGESDPTCVSIGGQGNFYGTVFAPTSDVIVGNPGENAGAVEGRTVTYENKGSFTQDQNVKTLVTTTSLGTYFPTAWHECSSPTPPPDPMGGC
jgi:Tfp pilus assembly protein PilX